MYSVLEILLTRLRLLKEYIISLVFLKVNQVSLSTAFIWSQLKFWSSSYQCFAISYFLLSQFFTDQEAVAQRYSVKKVFLEISRNLLENICASVPFLIMLQDSGLQLYLKRDSGTGVFMRISWTSFLIKHLQWLLLSFVFIWSVIFTEVNFFTVTTVSFINDVVFIFCSYLIFSFTNCMIMQNAFTVESRSSCEFWVYVLVFH